MSRTPKIGFIGAGKMATAVAVSLIKKLSPCDMTAYDILCDASDKFNSATGIGISKTLSEAINFSDILILAVKPQNFLGLFEKKTGMKDKLIISLMAGVRISDIRRESGATRIVRVMPNTPALVGKAISAYSLSAETSSDDWSIVGNILDSFGSSVLVEEDKMDAVTAVSGSGPAYVFEFIESLAKGGEACGLSYDLALKLAIETVEGAATLLKKTGDTPEQLKNNVTSPGGTTAKALTVFKDREFRDIVVSAVKAARDRSIELGRGER
ncbi:MAG TPA: pyrroline-5-carboxylate reductase [Victivallales bacterium]|mgnify:CR=1 FL=1|nr:pyrroline-5-carboxylate reductase [Victivallales bacterium]